MTPTLTLMTNVCTLRTFSSTRSCDCERRYLIIIHAAIARVNIYLCITAKYISTTLSETGIKVQLPLRPATA